MCCLFPKTKQNHEVLSCGAQLSDGAASVAFIQPGFPLLVLSFPTLCFEQLTSFL